MRGYTLLELLVVVAIVGILAAVALPKVFGAIESAKAGVTYGRLGALRDALKIYWVDHGGGRDAWQRYPWALDQLTGCTVHTPKHVYLDPDGQGDNPLPPEEVGDGLSAGDAPADWCDADGSHAYHENRIVDWWNPNLKGGWKYCIPGGWEAPTAPPAGVVWIDEDAIGPMGVSHADV